MQQQWGYFFSADYLIGFYMAKERHYQQFQDAVCIILLSAELIESNKKLCP